jgi:HSP20 family protein
MFALLPWRRERTAKGVIPKRENPFGLMHREFESLFNRFFGEWAWPEVWERPVGGFETEETEKEYLVRAELPGFEPPEVEVEVQGEVLTVKATYKETEEGKGEKKMGRYAEVKRSVLLPPGIVPEKIEAQYRNGMLEVHLPKAPEVVPRRIEVKT